VLTWIKIALRSLLKNRRRSFFTILAVGVGFAAINLFGGFTAYVFTGLRDGFIYGGGKGHLTVFKEDFFTYGALDGANYLLNEAETKTIREALRGFPEVVLVTGQLNITGLLSNGKVSTVFVAEGRVPSDKKAINRRATGMIGRLELYTGKALDDDVLYGIGLSSGLARLLDLAIGSDAIAMAPTVDGRINALDVKVFQLFEAPIEPLNDKMIEVPLKFAQSLYDTTSVDRLIVLLDETGQTASTRGALARALEERGLHVDVKTWEELSPFYTKAKDMFDIIFLFIFVIVVIIVVMSVINTIGMAVMERTREIGTLRAMGVKRGRVVSLFAIESAALGIFGSILGLGLTVAGWFIVMKILQPTWVPPHITKRVPLEVYLVPEYMLWSAICLVILAVGAAILPARKAAHEEIVDALGHV
jgi:putative ABC transport system permease protein